MLGALPIAAFGTEDQRRALLPAAVSGDAVLTAALAGIDPSDARTIPIEATRTGDGWTLRGVADTVPLADSAERILVPARVEDAETRVFLLEPAAATIERQEVTTGRPAFRMHIEAKNSDDDVLGGPETLRWIVDRGLVAIAVMQVGIAERALRITAEYVAGREQFERPLAAFQAVQQRIADMYIDVLAMRWTAWRALWRLAEGLPADEEIAVAKFWAADAGPRVIQAAQHLHGGMGVDVDYPLHRYTKEAKALELALGGATPQLERLGNLIAT